MLIYPKLTPPEFKVSHIETNSIHIIFSKEKDYKSLLEDCCKDWEIIWYGGYCGIDTEPK
jgi:hypothetical protein